MGMPPIMSTPVLQLTNPQLSFKVRLLNAKVVKASCMGVLRGRCAQRTLTNRILPATSLHCEQETFAGRSSVGATLVMQGCARGDQLRRHRGAYPQASTTVRGKPCLAGRKTPLEAHHIRVIGIKRALGGWSVFYNSGGHTSRGVGVSSATPRTGKRRERLVYGVEIKDSQD